MLRRTALAGLLAGLVQASLQGAAPIQVNDVYDQSWILNPKNSVSVILYSNASVQQRTREAGLALHPYVRKNAGSRPFHFLVVVDLRGSMANWAPGYTVRRIRADLEEKFRVLPPVPGREDVLAPRPDVSAVADFKGEACRSLGWDKPSSTLRVVIFRKGIEVKRWEDLRDLNELTDQVGRLMQ